MFYITTTLSEAQNLCTRIHQYLTNNRAKYNAVCWMDKPINNHSNPSEYAVVLPSEYPSILSDAEQNSLIDSLPSEWLPPEPVGMI